MELNNQIFEMVERVLKNEPSEIDEHFTKMCIGEATEEEKKQFHEKNSLKTDITEQIQKCFETGYKMAENQDKNLMSGDKLDEILILLKELDRRMNRIEKKLDIVEIVPTKERKFDPDNMSQYL